ncbi:MAG: GNAT family N-acetyltransferase [Defluviitaleaceae bacterium]|nr:GNAT family N-acetyltransferase [Defluviitaleaceae bacterium]
MGKKSGEVLFMNHFGCAIIGVILGFLIGLILTVNFILTMIIGLLIGMALDCLIYFRAKKSRAKTAANLHKEATEQGRGEGKDMDMIPERGKTAFEEIAKRISEPEAAENPKLPDGKGAYGWPGLKERATVPPYNAWIAPENAPDRGRASVSEADALRSGKSADMNRSGDRWKTLDTRKADDRWKAPESAAPADTAGNAAQAAGWDTPVSAKSANMPGSWQGPAASAANPANISGGWNAPANTASANAGAADASGGWKTPLNVRPADLSGNWGANAAEAANGRETAAIAGNWTQKPLNVKPADLSGGAPVNTASANASGGWETPVDTIPAGAAANWNISSAANPVTQGAPNVKPADFPGSAPANTAPANAGGWGSAANADPANPAGGWATPPNTRPADFPGNWGTASSVNGAGGWQTPVGADSAGMPGNYAAPAAFAPGWYADAKPANLPGSWNLPPAANPAGAPLGASGGWTPTKASPPERTGEISLRASSANNSSANNTNRWSVMDVNKPPAPQDAKNNEAGYGAANAAGVSDYGWQSAQPVYSSPGYVQQGAQPTAGTSDYGWQNSLPAAGASDYGWQNAQAKSADYGYQPGQTAQAEPPKPAPQWKAVDVTKTAKEKAVPVPTAFAPKEQTVQASRFIQRDMRQAEAPAAAAQAAMGESKFDIHDMTEDELGQVFDLFCRLYSYLRELGHVYSLNQAYLSDYLRIQLDSNHGKVFVLCEGRNVCGFAVVSTPLLNKMLNVDGRRNIGILSELYVKPEYRGRGFGKALLARSEEFLRGLGVAHVQIEVVKNNAAAAAMYERSGYTQIFSTYMKTI